ncbi:homocysteine-responsive endoplasmic reticulum-resident ubiquitin-like domain member 2 protein [Fopius arisanus]|uniref:Homocysteine-responsive endoplasmic reticulum-resident ubiquitin-like domain member 2 protein n=1 Tax=Fopius arisanus TaxID=64838 RepID=A0A9R1U4V3_9HYME|nr:PREDICTED: homocysteine-responsive endoplasmic reticulum-resident ubiquitin-like domain member 2 protein [Fopius arisanus]XP_011308609.1 PREDICTED: homocysteine-responsive endoplasmic reticulum-resident ubiquitin-like domain member 2 protein [Fopius arisanus]
MGENSDVEMINLLVKAPDQQISDQIVKCQLHWTVGRLKEHLETVYPTKPKRCEQKVIFSGQLLSDSMILQDVLPQNYNQNEPLDNTYIIHLVCTLKSTNYQSLPSYQAPSSTVHTSDIMTPPPTVQQYYSQLNSQQMAWMQQAYAHYLTQYMHLMSAQGIQVENTIPYVQSTNVRRPDVASNTNNQTHNNANQDEGNDDNHGAEQEGADAGVNPANNNVRENREAGVVYDWLDVFDFITRFFVLSSIVYFYSSPSRFLVVTFLGFAIYLLQGGFFRGQPIFPNDNGRAENDNNADNEGAQPAESNHQRNPAPAAEPPPQDLRGTNPNEDNGRPGAWAFTWTFFSSFFTSLIPEQPPPVL